MNADQKYIRYTWFILLMVILVIAAGGVVRMTQSGMGCPDWPKCFGRWIPPTSAAQLPADFEKYLRAQDIDHSFNAYHTWIEYINRLLGALLGVFIFIHFIWSFRKFRKTNRKIVLFSFFLLIAVGFQGWLGKKVVDHNLEVVKVTIHMLMALVIAAIPLLIIYRLKADTKIADKFLKGLSVAVLILLLVQIILGTQVREQVDEISKTLLYEQRELWIQRLDNMFILHRSFSWLVAAGCLLLFIKARRYVNLRANATIILSVVALTILLGITMAWYNIPAIAQPLHLLLASILTLAVFALRLRLQ
jgi:cytochrome c oxidase assembly protein subunit 15